MQENRSPSRQAVGSPSLRGGACAARIGCVANGDSVGPNDPGPGGKGDDNASSTGVIARHEGIDGGEAEATPAALDFERYTGTPYMQLYLEFPNDDVHDETELFTFDLDQYTALFRSREPFAYDSLEAWTENSPPSGFSMIPWV